MTSCFTRPFFVIKVSDIRFSVFFRQSNNGFIDKTQTLEKAHLQCLFLFVSAKVKQPVYAFSAYDLSSFTPTSGCTLVFAKTHLNDDGLYSTTTGKYTTPADGIYVFHSTLTSRYTTKDVYVEFKADERSIGKFMVRDYTYDISSSGSATTRLQKGTEVYLRVTAVGSGYRFKENLYYMNTFSGYSISH